MVVNRLTHIREAVRAELGEINGINVLESFNLEDWKTYDFDYVFVRTSEGEQLEPETIYQDGTFKRCESNLNIGIYGGYQDEGEKGAERMLELIRVKLSGFWIPPFKVETIDFIEEINCNPLVPVASTGYLREGQYGLVYYSFTINTTILQL